MLYHDFFKVVDEILNDKKTYINIPHNILYLAGWVFELIEKKFRNFDPPVIKSSVHVAKMQRKFDNQKLVKMGFKFRDPVSSIADTVNWLIENKLKNLNQDN